MHGWRGVALVVVAVAMLGLVPAAGASETRMYQMDPAHTGVVEDAKLGTRLTHAWSLEPAGDFSGGGRTHLTPLAADGVTYSVTRGSLDDWRVPNEVTAFDIRTGRRLWSTPIPRSSVSQGGTSVHLAMDDERVYALLWQDLYGLDRATGAVEWWAPVNQWSPTPPVLHDGLIVFEASGSGSNSFAYRASDGARMWIAAGGDGPVVVGGGLAFMSVTCETRTGVRLPDGALLHHTRGYCSGGGELSGAFDGTHFWLANRLRSELTGVQGYIYDLRGTPVARFDGHSPAVAAPYVYVARTERLVALDRLSRREMWSTALDSEIVSAPLVADGHVVVRTYEFVYMVDRHDGTIVSRVGVTPIIRAPDPTFAAGIAVSDGYVVVPALSGFEVLRGEGAEDPPASEPAASIPSPAMAPAPSFGDPVATRRCAAVRARLPRRLKSAKVRVGGRRVPVRRASGRLWVRVGPRLAVRGVVRLRIDGRTRNGSRVRTSLRIVVCQPG